MKNITVTVDDEVYRRARIKAAQQDTSVSAMVKAALQAIAAGESELEASKRQESELRASILEFRATDRLDRDAIHSRR